jgi:hypothetical protein
MEKAHVDTNVRAGFPASTHLMARIKAGRLVGRYPGWRTSHATFPVP